MTQEKLLSDQNVDDQGYTQKQNKLEINEVKITKNITEVKVVNDNDWDDYNWYPDTH